ncbi:MAG: hypothetical protein HKN82_14420 [Akkermansiaceae bacterium]|nr:hypothetical protein [Akkermansiaceae bacterium]
MRLLCLLAALGLAACTPGGARRSGLAGPTLLGSDGPLIPTGGGPATEVQRRAPEAPPMLPPPAANAGPAPAPAARPAPAPAADLLATAARRITVDGMTISYLVFDDRRCEIAVADKSAGLNSEWQTAAVAAADHDAIAAINGGFFTPEGKPLGLVVENGNLYGAWNGSSSLTSGVLIVTAARSGLARREKWSPRRPAEHLLQAGPLLLDAGKAVGGLSKDPERPRSFIAWDGGHHWVIAYVRSASLAGLAAGLATQPIPEMRLRTALNLDGGSSSDLWISPAVRGGPVSTRQFWNKPVRNYVIIRERTP